MDAMRRHDFDVRYYPNSVLGSDDQRLELVELDLLRVNESGAPLINQLSPLYAASSLPFLFDDYSQYDRFLASSGFREAVNRDLAASNLELLDIALLGGMSGIFNTVRDCRNIADFAGLRLRAMDRKDITLLGAWGIPATPVAWEEVSEALQTGVAHGYVNPPLVPLIFGHTQQIRHFLDLRIAPSGRLILVSRSWHQSLPAELRRLFANAVAVAHAANRHWHAQVVEVELARLTKAGVTVSRPSDADRGQFVQRARAHYEQIATPEAVRLIRPYLQRIGGTP
jgi:TRAP-type transport system periplasmic protein